jgi:predicted regulator of Ras-like GTPase activity (Roadblock/LC7/MglB family)
MMVLVDGDGMVVAAAGDGPREALELIAASYMDLARRAAYANREGDLEPPSEMTVAGPSGAILYQAITGDYGLLAALDPEGLAGRARFELRKLAVRLVPELEV